MKKIFIIGAIAIIGIFVIFIYGVNKKNNTSQTSKTIKVAVSFYPLAEFAKQVGGDRVEVVNITPAGVEPHDFEPTPKDVATLFLSKIFIFNGAGFDPWAEKLKPDLEQKGVVTINMTEYFDIIDDPHIWLDPVFAQKEVEVIRDALIRVDLSNNSEYTNNAARYIEQLSILNDKYKNSLTSCQTRDAVTSHAAFGYFAKRYNINIISIADISPEKEPSPKRMAEIAQLAKQKNIKHIFFETLVNPKLSEIIAREIGAKTLIFNPLEGLTNEEITRGENYISVMEKNLINLRIALRCK